MMGTQTAAYAPDEFATILDREVTDKHPFIHSRWSRALLDGKLTWRDLKTFAGEFEHFLRFTPSHFFCLGASLPYVIPEDGDLRRDFAENLLDDMGILDRAKDHFLLFRRFAYRVGWTAKELEGSVPLPTTTAFNYGLMYLAKNLHPSESIAIISWANESLFSLGLTRRWEDALMGYGLRREELFLPPVEEEEKHVSAPRRAVIEYASTERTQRRILALFHIVFDLWTVFFDGLERAPA